MPRKGMRTLWFSPRKAITLSPSSMSTPRSIFSNEIMDRSLINAETMITKWDPDVSTFAKVTSLFYENRRGAGEFIRCVGELQKSMHFIVMEDPYSEKLRHAKDLMGISMKRLQKEFYQILSMNRAHLDPESMSASARSSLTSRSSISDFDDEDDEIRVVEDSINEVEDVSNLAMVDLRSIAECMIQCGYGKECVTIYKLIRKSIIDEGIYKLGVQKFSASHVHKMEWHAVELKIKNWMEAVNISVKTLFTGEKILCDHVFASSKNIRDSCFADISNEGAHILFGFPEIVAKSSKKSPEKLFRLLDMYVAIWGKWPQIDSIFCSELSATVRSQVISSLNRISEFVRTDIKEFECVIQKDTLKTLVVGGGIHSLTTLVVNYLIALSDYSCVLTDVFAGYSPQSRSSIQESLFDASMSEDSEAYIVSQLFAWLVLVLICKLDTKSKHYNDISLAYLFLANNVQHIVTKVRTSNLKFILSEDWLTRHENKVKQFAANYRRLAWDNVVHLLTEKPKGEMSKEEATEWFMRFNTVFEKAHRKQSMCVIPDRNLRDAIKVSIAKNTVPVYKELYNTHKVSLLGMGNFTSVIKFAPEDVANWLSNLYFVTTESAGSASSSPHSSERTPMSR